VAASSDINLEYHPKKGSKATALKGAANRSPDTRIYGEAIHKYESKVYNSNSSGSGRFAGNIKQVNITYIIPNTNEKRDATGLQNKMARLIIQWKDSDSQQEACPNTCGWLLSEFIRRTEPDTLYNTGESVKTSEFTTIALKSKGSSHITLDCYLTHFERSLSHLANNEELEAVQVRTEEI
jgi:hypothetical protein